MDNVCFVDWGKNKGLNPENGNSPDFLSIKKFYQTPINLINDVFLMLFKKTSLTHFDIYYLMFGSSKP